MVDDAVSVDPMDFAPPAVHRRVFVGDPSGTMVRDTAGSARCSDWVGALGELHALVLGSDAHFDRSDRVRPREHCLLHPPARFLMTEGCDMKTTGSIA